MTNNIVAFSQYVANCSGNITDGDYNLDSGASCGFDPVNHSITNTDPLLGLLNDNGGPTLTYSLQSGSPAINSGNCDTETQIDQRYIIRPQQSLCDIGSYELTDYPFVMVKDDSYVTQENTPLVKDFPGVLWNDYFKDGGSLSISSLPTHGSIVLNIDGSFIYEPNSDYYGTDRFTYTAAVGDRSDTAEVLITVYPVVELKVMYTNYLPMVKND